MARHDLDIPGIRRAMREGLGKLNDKGMTNGHGTKFMTTACQDRPVPFVEVRQTPEQAAELCGVDTEDECPLLELCQPMGYTESVYSDDFVYGGLAWRRGKPLPAYHPVSETPPMKENRYE